MSKYGQYWCTDGNTKRIAGNQLAGLRDAYAKIMGDIGKQAHDDKLGHADCKGAKGKA
ncbi:hypothetical protein D3C80_2118740 [compost metagenome]